jgi:hypothetical protein
MTALAVQPRAGSDRAILKPVEMPRSEAVEKALIEGDLSGLSASDRWDYYVMRCRAADLDPRAQPFQYIRLPARKSKDGRGDEPGKLILYASKGTADQLIAKHQLSVKIVSRGFDKDLSSYVVEARATFPSGQTVDNLGAVFIYEDARGEALPNAVMKATTKAIRRTVLSACGLGMLDESEIEAIPGAVRVEEPPAPKAIEPPPRPKPESEDLVRAKDFIRSAIRASADEVKADMILKDMPGEYEPPNGHAVRNHLVSDWIDKGLMTHEDVGKVNAKGELVRDKDKAESALASAWYEDDELFKREVREYLKAKADEFLADAANGQTEAG